MKEVHRHTLAVTLRTLIKALVAEVTTPFRHFRPLAARKGFMVISPNQGGKEAKSEDWKF